MANEVVIRITAQDQASGVLTAINQKASGIGQTFANLGAKMTAAGRSMTMGLTLPIVGVGVAATKMGMDFNESLDHIVGLVGVSREQVNAWKKDIYGISEATAKGPGELADALFFVTSAGLRGQDALDALDASARAAAAGLGETKVVADAVTSAMNAYGAENLSASQATATLVAIVREGKAEAAEIAPVLGRVISVAANLGVSFDQVGAAIAIMTRTTGDADNAATSLSAIFSALIKPTSAAAEALNKMGLSSDGLRQELREKGLLSVLRTLSAAIGDNAEAMGEVVPNIRALRGFLNITGQDAAEVDRIFASLAGTTDEDLNTAFNAVAQGPGFKMRQALNQLRIEAVKLGDTLGPILVDTVIPAFKQVGGVVKQAFEAFQSLPKPVQTGVVAFAALAAVLGPLLMILGSIASGISALIALAPVLGAAITAATGPIGIMVVTVAALTAALGYLIASAEETKGTLREVSFSIGLVSGKLERLQGNLAGLEGQTGRMAEAIRRGIAAKIEETEATLDWLQGEAKKRAAQESEIQRFLDMKESMEKANEEREALIALAEAQAEWERKVADATGGATAAIDGMGEQLSDTQRALMALAQTLNESGLSLEAYQIALYVAGRAMDTFGLSADELRRVFDASGLSVTEFITRLHSLTMLEDLRRQTEDTTDAVNGLYDAFNRLFTRPSREEAAINLQLAELREQRARLIQRGYDEDSRRVKKVDEQIQEIQEEIDLRRAHKDVLRAELDVANQLLPTDEQLEAAARGIIDALGPASDEAATMAGNLYMSTVALQEWTGQLGRWMDEVRSVPQFAEGGIVPGPTGQPRLVIAHGGEPILPIGSQTSIGHQGMNNYGQLTVQVVGSGDDLLHQLERILR